MKNIIIASLLLLAHVVVMGQNTEGKIMYDYKYNWVQVNSKLTFLSKEEKDRMQLVWGNEDNGEGTPMKLIFDDKQSLYTYGREQGQTDDGQWSWRQDDYLVYRNFDQQKIVEWYEMLGKTYVINDSLMTYTWRVQNQIKDIAGYVCMKAETFDPIKNHKITAWFAQDIPVGVGPERYFGLPGAILELDLNDGDVVVTAKKIEWKKVADELKLPAKMKGKKITNNEYDQLIKKHIFDSIKAQRNPYWTIRY